ncbi:OmpA family protein [Methylocaldum sp.]|jgi:outer membrane protein OmpA-like peptidoglycan-associated protein|uniref:OmpA family protein n=1 Tax=Methylocaldum sp. TaxID=1969727 RepID=UPI00321F7A5E
MPTFWRMLLEHGGAKIGAAVAIISVVVLAAGCQVQPSQSYAQSQYLLPPRNAGIVTPLNLQALPETIGKEHQFRVQRLARLSREFGAQSPRVTESQIAVGKVPGADYPVPVIRFHYPERTFFDFGSAAVRPDAGSVLDVLAEQMNRDMPDTSLVILGHTDSIGTDEYNYNLSISRAAAVMRELARRGVNLEQMATVGIGETQPIATNGTDQGRALNRRVEFMLSRFEEANYVAIEQFPRNAQWLNNHQEATVKPKTPVVHHDTGKKELVVLKPKPNIVTRPEAPQTAQPKPADTANVLEPSPRVVTIIPAETVHVLPSS